MSRAIRYAYGRAQGLMAADGLFDSAGRPMFAGDFFKDAALLSATVLGTAMLTPESAEVTPFLILSTIKDEWADVLCSTGAVAPMTEDFLEFHARYGLDAKALCSRVLQVLGTQEPLPGAITDSVAGVELAYLQAARTTAGVRESAFDDDAARRLLLGCKDALTGLAAEVTRQPFPTDASMMIYHCSIARAWSVLHTMRRIADDDASLKRDRFGIPEWIEPVADELFLNVGLRQLSTRMPNSWAMQMVFDASVGIYAADDEALVAVLSAFCHDNAMTVLLPDYQKEVMAAA